MDSDQHLFEKWLKEKPILDKDNPQKQRTKKQKTKKQKTQRQRTKKNHYRAFQELESELSSYCSPNSSSSSSSSSSSLHSKSDNSLADRKKFYNEGPEIQEHWLQTEGIYDKDQKEKQEKICKHPGSSFPVDAEFDLHQLTVKRALDEAKRFIIQSHKKNYHLIKIIHGKGKHSSDGPKIKVALLKWCENEGKTWIKSSKPSNPKQGGRGATLFWLK